MAKSRFSEEQIIARLANGFWPDEEIPSRI